MKRNRNIILLLLLACAQMIMAQHVLTGTVMDKVFNEPLVGANVYVANASNRSLGGSIADVNGNYRLSIPDQKDLSIVFSFIGYKTQTIKYTGQKVINVTLDEEGMALETVEVTAKKIERNSMGQSAREMISATQKLTLGSLETAPVTSVTEALQGAMANVDILTGADPGSGSSIRIRGTASLNASNEPLFVVDGVPLPVDISDDFSFASANSDDYGSLLNISPADIESIEVLKDAAATAVWGSKGANGVLIIKTKRGSKGRLQFNFNTKYEFSKERSGIPMLNANQYISMIQDAVYNTVSDLGSSAAKSQEYLKLLYNTKEIGFDPDWQYFDEYNQNTNWLDEITQTGFISDNSFSVSGGGDKANYRLSLGYLNQEGTTIGTGYERFNASFNTDYRFSDKLDIALQYSFTRGVTDANYVDDTDELKKASIRGHALTKMPNMSPYVIGANGQRTGEYFTPYESFGMTFSNDKVYNPVAMANEAQNRTIATNSRMTFVLHAKPFKSLDYFGTVGFNGQFTKINRFLPQSVTGVAYEHESSALNYDIGKDLLYLTTENRLVYNQSINDNHKLLLSGIFQTSDQTTSTYSSRSANTASSGITSPIAGSTTAKGGSGKTINRDMGLTLNGQYIFKEKYMFNAGYRWEASSAMDASGRWGGFPTFGVAWHLGDEEFIQRLGFISLIKLRYSWGQSGNAPTGTSPYIGKFSAVTPGYGDMSAVKPESPDLTHLKYETITSNNIGVDVGLFSDRITFAVELYTKVTDDMLQKKIKVPSSTGLSTVAWYNSGKMENRGWEFNIDVAAVRTKDWGLNFGFNISQNKNKVLELPENQSDETYTFGNKKYAYRVLMGDPLGSFYGYRYKGVYQNVEETYAVDKTGQQIMDINGAPVVVKNGDQKVYPGDAKYEDVNGDGVIDENDIVYLGNSNPTLTGGLNFTLRYKKLSLVAALHGRAGQKVINESRINMENMYGKNNQSVAVLRRWRSEGDNTDIPRALYDKGYNYLGSDRFVEDASFLRLKTITLKYQFPENWMKPLGINKLEIYATGYDLFVWTKYTGQDPEINLKNLDGSAAQVAIDSNNTPKAMRFAFGLNLRF
ncbi:SusC/RagA family TonB-linked outer membrane protein [Bacteroides nordii]|uniref:SusC/RagA family TonB-linked outer membrane protein n=1 Tax=Bacteroides nordii TaxID=291645 RepID=UPI001897E4E6|nr:TonB-dependent receptor [Bacteroides nordii]